MWVNPPEGIVGPVVFALPGPWSRSAGSGSPAGSDPRSPVALRLALTSDLPLTPRSGYPCYRPPCLRSLPPSQLVWGIAPPDDPARASAAGSVGSRRHDLTARVVLPQVGHYSAATALQFPV